MAVHAPWTKGELKIDRSNNTTGSQATCLRPTFNDRKSQLQSVLGWRRGVAQILKTQSGMQINEVNWKGKRRDKTLTGTKQRTAQFTETSD